MEYSTEKEILQAIFERGFEGMSEAVQNLFNLAMKLERENILKASPCQRTEGRTGYANGFKERHIQSRVGELALQIPQTRNVEFYPSCLERGLCSERAINLAMAEMYIQGVASRSVRNILEKRCRLEVSAMQVSRATKRLDEEFEKWRNRPIKDAVKYLLLDALNLENLKFSLVKPKALKAVQTTLLSSRNSLKFTVPVLTVIFCL